MHAVPSWLHRRRQHNLEPGSAGRRVADGRAAVVLTDDAVDHGEAEADAPPSVRLLGWIE